MAAPKKVDYDRIEPGWRAGLKSAEQLASEYSRETGIKVSAAAVRKHFGKKGVPRDLTAQVKAKADAKVLAAMVDSTKRAATQAETVDAAATEIATVRLEHRIDVRRTRRIVGKLTQDLAAIADRPELVDEMAQALAAEDDAVAPALRAALNRVTALPTQVTVVKGLAEALRTLVAIEREAYGMDADPEKPPAERPVEDWSDDELIADIKARRAIAAAQASSEGA